MVSPPNEKLPLVSVVVTVFNCEQFILNALKSVAQQTYKNWELIVCDDNSRDSSRELIKKAQRVFQNTGRDFTLLIHKKNYGCGRSLRDCINVSKGEIIATLDGDDFLYKEALEKSVKCHLENPDCSLVYTNMVAINTVTGTITNRTSRQINYEIGESFLEPKEPVRILQLRSFKMKNYKKTEGVNKTLRKSVDRDLVLKLEETGKLVYLPETLYQYNMRPGSIIRSYFTLPKHLKDNLDRKHKQIFDEARCRRNNKN